MKKNNGLPTLIFRFACTVFLVYQLSPINASAQFSPIWDHANDPSAADDDVQGLALDPGGVYAAGFDRTPGNQQLRIEKRSPATGALLPSFGQGGVLTIDPTPSDDVANGIAVDATGIYVTGSELICLGCDAKWHIEKRDAATGSPIWTQLSNPSMNPDGSNAVAVDPGGVYVVGTVGISFLNWAWRVEKRSPGSGALIWGHTLDVSNLGDTPYGVAVDATGVYTVGYDYTAGNQGWRIEKRDLTTGLVIWAQPSNPGAGDDYAKSVAVDATGLYVAGVDQSPGGSDTQWRIEKRDPATGALVPGFGVGGVVVSNLSTGPDEARAITCDSTGIYIAGIDYAVGNRQWHLEKRDLATGTLICSSSVDPSPSSDYANAIALDAGGVYVGGSDLIMPSNEWRIEKYKLCSGPTAANGPLPGIGISLYPNPATSICVIDAGVLQRIGVRVFDVFGHAVIQRTLEPGTRQLDIRALVPGVYAVRLDTGTGSYALKLMIRR